MKLYPIIMAGGVGTRLWPLSREEHPKQFHALLGERTLFQETVARLSGLEGVAPPVIVCNEHHRFLVADQLREIDEQFAVLILEPAGRNTAPALSLAAEHLATNGEDGDSDRLMLVMPADHVIPDVAAFQAAVRAAIPLAESGSIVTFGVVPTGPETGYGYIKTGGKVAGATGALVPRQVSAFVEKPDEETAAKYVTSGEYLWNSGIFMVCASVWRAELDRYRPDIAKAVTVSYGGGRRDGEFYRPDKELFEECPRESIDYAVMEPSAGSDSTSHALVPLDAGWSDAGAWSALWSRGEPDAQGNVTRGDVHTDSSRNNLLISQGRLLATVGVEDLTVVETADAVLVARRDRDQELKKLVGELKAKERPEHAIHPKVHRPWGAYEILETGQFFQVKHLTIKPGASISLQTHAHRSEHWVVVKGTATVRRDDDTFTLTENESTHIPVGAKHRLTNCEDQLLEVVEVQVGGYLGEDDIERFQDDYDRAPAE